MKEITYKELKTLPEDSYVLIDIRDEGLTSYGMIPGAVHINLEELEEGSGDRIAAIPADKTLIFYCEIGRKSREIDELPCLKGRHCLSLEGGYVGYIRAGISSKEDIEEKQKKA